MNDKIEVKSLEGLINQAQLSEIVSGIVSFYNGKIDALEKRIADLEAAGITTANGMTVQTFER